MPTNNKKTNRKKTYPPEQSNHNIETLLAHSKSHCGNGICPVSVPIYQTSSFVNTGPDIKYSYTRCDNPTRSALEEKMARLENGCGAFAFSSGLAAASACFSLLKSGDEVLICEDIYGGTYRLVTKIFSRFGIKFRLLPFTSFAYIEKHLNENTKMLYFETPTNPMMRIVDIRTAVNLAHSRGCLCVVDNTFLTPYFQRPLDLGADICLYSATKFLSGHHDTTAGIIVVKNQRLAARFDLLIKTLGSALSPFEAFLVLRGLKTLALRMECHQKNAFAAFNALVGHPRVERVYFCGDESHPDYSIHKSQSCGHGGMLSFVLRDKKEVYKFLSRVRLIKYAESLGGTETLVTYPRTQTHSSIPAKLRERLGINDRLIRLSVGLEAGKDIVSDLLSALD